MSTTALYQAPSNQVSILLFTFSYFLFNNTKHKNSNVVRLDLSNNNCGERNWPFYYDHEVTIPKSGQHIFEWCLSIEIYSLLWTTTTYKFAIFNLQSYDAKHAHELLYRKCKFTVSKSNTFSSIQTIYLSLINQL